jgi:hypothetical protein
MHVTIDVSARGETHSYTCTGPQGAWGQPPLSDARHDVKLRDCLGRGLEPAAVDELLALLHRLESLDAGAIRRVCELIA